MHSLLAAAAFFAIIVFSTVTANADVITIGHTTFDFDAPSSPLTAGQQSFFQHFKDAINRRDEAALMSLQDNSVSSCTVVNRKLILLESCTPGSVGEVSSNRHLYPT
jgi:hypothetical protein